MTVFLRFYFLSVLTFILLLSGRMTVSAQAPFPPKSAAEIQHDLGKLSVLGSVLYIAAHPDDENTRLITYLAQGKGYRTAYLSLTRGDGGQNLIGDEKGTSLGILRTQELLAARRIDGGEQMFSRAYDFGYSKTPEETLEIWDKEKVLGDVVWAIRKFRPDVVITRFPTMEKGGGGHGHHTSSAILAHEAFGLAANPSAYPEQLKYVEPWQPKRLLWNAFTWRGTIEDFYPDPSDVLTLNVGEYDPLLGRNYGEIAGEARSMHKCQAFGSARARGDLTEHLGHELGEKAMGDLFSGIETSWKRVAGAEEVLKLLKEAYNQFSPTQPEKVIPQLIEAYKILENLDGYWAEFKREKLKESIAYCSGLWFEINSLEPSIPTGQVPEFEINIVKRGNSPVSWTDVTGEAMVPEVLEKNVEVKKRFKADNSFSKAPDQPYWLVQPQEKGIFQVDDQTLIGLPQNPPVYFDLTFSIEGTLINFHTPAVYRYVDRAAGELYRPFVVTPEATVNISDNVFLFADQNAQQSDVLIRSFVAGKEIHVRFEVPEGWHVTPSMLSINAKEAGEEQIKSIQIHPPENQSVGKLRAVVEIDGKESSYSYSSIEYSHIPTQLVFYPSETQLVRVNLRKKGERIGYIMGSGDEIPDCLRQIGYEVDLLSDDNITLDQLQKYDAVIAGIRVYNTNKRMAFHQKVLFDYVERGGTYLVQYNTSGGMATSEPGPYPIKISRDRVSVEEAPVTILKPNHPAFNSPNKITESDFEGWIQERGLYFPGEWDEKYEALTSCHDPGESAKEGGLLVAKYGNGYFVYTGYSWFRELPAGVPGAYRIFANLISLGK